jgi:hypothetical protein
MLKLNVIPLTAAISFPYHQAAVGKITEEEVEYLMARGYDLRRGHIYHCSRLP